MRPAYRGIAVGIIQCLIVLSLAGKYAFDRERLPRVWARSAPYDPDLPVRGRYVSLQLLVDGPPSKKDVYSWLLARLAVENGRLVARESPFGSGVNIMNRGDRGWVIAEPIAYFIPEHAKDPSRRAVDEELWVEVSVPKNGPPRPLRLGVKKNGVLTPLDVK